MDIVYKQKPLKKRAQYRKIALQIRGTTQAAFFNSKSDMEDFRRVVGQMNLQCQTQKDNGDKR